MEFYYTLMFFILGITLGSFYNVVGYRLPKGESLVYPPSHCPKCNRRLTPIELIPVLSFIIQKGKCKGCSSKISLFYPFFEFMTGFLFALVYLIFGFSLDLVIVLIFISMSLIIIISDYKYFIISDEVLVVSVILFVITLYFKIGKVQLLYSLIDGVIAFTVMFLIKKLGDFLFKKESMGGGDIKLLFVFGLVLGWEMAILSIFIASFLGLPVSFILSKKNDENIIPFGPFLVIAALIIIFLKIDINTIINLYNLFIIR